MPATTSPFFGINYGWTTGEASWGDPINSNFKALSFLGKGAVDSFVAALPGSPSEGNSVVLTTDNKFYVRIGGSWLFITPQSGMEVNETTTGKRWLYSGSWAEIPSSNSLATRVTSLEDDKVKGNDDKKYNVIAATVRRDTAINPNWQIISDSAHIPVNFTGVVGGTELELDYLGSKIGTLIVAPDERAAACGVTVGGSVGATQAFVRAGVPCSFTIDLATNTITPDSRFFGASRFSVSVAGSGLITITHPQLQTNLKAIVQAYTDSSSAELRIPFDVRTPSSGLTTLFLLRRMAGRINYTGSVWGTSNSPFNSLITSTYDTGTGILTVTHPTINGNVQPVVTAYGNAAVDYVPLVLASTGTGFQVKFRKLSDGSIPVGTPTDMGFYFDRGFTALDQTPAGKLHVHIGHVQIDMSQWDFALSNLWISGLMET